MKYFLAFAAMLFSLPVGASEITTDELTNLPPADVVVLGEVHDNALHHAGQATALRVIRPRAVVFEMLSPEQVAMVSPALLTDQVALEVALGWNGSGWPDFAIYYPVFAALGEAKIYGAKRSRDEVRRAFAEGAAAVFGQGYGLDEPLPDGELEQRTQEQFEAHCEAVPLEMMGGMVEAQRFRDATFAATVVEAFEATGGPVVLITGNGHARVDWGVPALLKQENPTLSVLSLAFLEKPAEDNPPYDLWIMTEPAEREDPCLVFK